MYCLPYQGEETGRSYNEIESNDVRYQKVAGRIEGVHSQQVICDFHSGVELSGVDSSTVKSFAGTTIFTNLKVT